MWWSSSSSRISTLALLVVILGVGLIPSAEGQFGSPQRRVSVLRQIGGTRVRASFPSPNEPVAAPVVTSTRQQNYNPFQYNPASAAVTELARTIGSILGQQKKAAVFSPVSIACALSLMLLGANHETKNELVQVLGFQQFASHLDNIHRLYSEMLNDLARTEFDVSPPPWRTANPCYDDDEDEEDAALDARYPLQKDVIRVTNAVFVQEGLPLDGSFQFYSNRYYNSTAQNVPFGTNPARAAGLINAWVQRSTEGKIRDILSEAVAAEAEMIVASALYFKGLWSEPFEQQSTEMKPFFPDGHGRESKPVLVMSTVACFPYYDAVEYDAKIVGLSYQGNKTALYIIMPNNSTRQVMQDFQRRLTPAMIGDMVFKMSQRKMYLQLPKMRITNTINLRDVLQRLGLRTIFNRGQSDLTGMIARSSTVTQFATHEQLHVSEFIHRVELDINEKGTEGGAVTTSTIFRALPSVHFRVDAPFLILLGHDGTRLPLFYGTIYDPTPRLTPMTRPAIVSRFSSRQGFENTPAPAASVPTRSQISTPSISMTPGNDPKIAQTVVDMTMRLSRTLAQQQSKTELFSPVSIVTVANLLFLGSSGATHAEFNKLLTPASMNWKQLHQRYGSVLANLVSPNPIDARREQWRQQTCPQDEDYEDGSSSTPAQKSQVIRLANGVFYQKDLQMRQQYERLARSLYGALIQPIDPRNGAASSSTINKWVSDVTAGKIRNMLEGPLSSSSSMVIVNALYFKGKWKTQFEPMVTRQGPFFPDGYDGSSFSVKMMSLSGCLPFYKATDPMEVSIVGLPYRDDSSTMYLIQPANSSRTAIRRLQASLTGKMLESWIGQMKLQSTMVRLPKMHLRNSVDLLQSFQKLGFNSILSPAKSDLSNMVDSGTDGPKPYVNQIMHKIDLSIDEEGTEGAAATSALVDRISSQRRFNGNTPFLVYLRHDATGLPLFYGPIFDPR
ncbi:uncharacterized protein LOC128722458 [Anopheles nili]|uniref:uncharacterized protein LOC128722458 n=1 Tax=Anopheles nili TaxID=185578 RepID=UPI00237C055C|nr:uncharacterized protein LOC128722458 [Anopheles nili]